MQPSWRLREVPPSREEPGRKEQALCGVPPAVTCSPEQAKWPVEPQSGERSLRHFDQATVRLRLGAFRLTRTESPGIARVQASSPTSSRWVWSL